MYATASATRIKAARRLTKRAFRERERSFLAEGPQAVSEALATGARVSGLFVTAPAQAKHADLVDAAADAGVEVQLVSGEVMGELAQTITPQGLLAVCDFIDLPLDRLDTRAMRLVAVLANVRDPGNAGTVLRTADAAGADAVIFADASVDLYNGKCVRASAGSLFHLPVVAGGPLPETIATLKRAGLRVFAADGRAGVTLDDPATRASLEAPTAWLFGNEAWGLPDELLALADESVAVPIYGRAESLNLASAAAVCLYASASGQRAATGLCDPGGTRENTWRAIMITSRRTPLCLPANPRGNGYIRYNVAKSRCGALSVRYVDALESDHIPSPASRNAPATAAQMRPLLDGGVAVVEDNQPGPGVRAPGAAVPTPFGRGAVTDAQAQMADELPDGLVVADEAGRLVVFNRAAVRLTSIAADEAIGKYVFDVLPFRDEDGRDWWVCVDPYHGLSTRARHPERSLFLTDGTELLVSVGYVRDGRSGPVRRLVISLRGAQQRARLERSRAELVSTVAHELRSPLTSVKGFTATLLAKWGRFTDDQKRVMLETVNADADRVTRLITELLDVSRIESGRMEVHRQLVDVPDRARKIIAGRVAAGDPEDRFRLSAAPDLPETWLDADKIDQILGNLVENAVRHGAGIVTVMVDSAHAVAGDQPGGIVVSVRDQGEGIPPEIAPRVFRQFWRGKRRGGTGLGLYIVKGLVEALGGDISVGRAPGGGAEFRFTVPAGAPIA
jgi:tRNA G18 (ribose-2'-O)-methylase SpoU/signal transduction histidine kinase